MPGTPLKERLRGLATRKVGLAPSFAIAGILYLASVAYYLKFGTSWTQLFSWGFSQLVIARNFHRIQPGRALKRTFTAMDWAILAFLLLAFSPLYLLASYSIPFRVVTDEISYIGQAAGLAATLPPDPFGLSSYFHFPNGMFLHSGLISRALGGPTFENMRHASGLLGLLSLGVAYFFFRTFRSRRFAIMATLVLGGCHAYFSVCRMANSNTPPVTVLILGLALLVRAVRRGSYGALYFAGTVSALSLYQYVPARLVVVIWAFYLFELCWTARTRSRIRAILKPMWPAALGFALCALPFIGATLSSHETAIPEYQQSQLIIYPRARELVRSWEGGADTGTALLRNAWKGVTMFNNNIEDRSNNYINVGHGVVDPLTGILLWIGFISLWRRSSRQSRSLVVLVGFITIWAIASLLTTKNPAYGRILIVLPFVAFLATEGIVRTCTRAARLLARHPRFRFKATRDFVAATLVCVILVWNLSIYRDFVIDGIIKGDTCGATTRYFNERSGISGYSFTFVGTDKNPYYWWGGNDGWRNWMSVISPGQSINVVAPEAISVEGIMSKHRPFSLLMSKEIYRQLRPRITPINGDVRFHPMTPSYDQVAIEFL